MLSVLKVKGTFAPYIGCAWSGRFILAAQLLRYFVMSYTVVTVRFIVRVVCLFGCVCVCCARDQCEGSHREQLLCVKWGPDPPTKGRPPRDGMLLDRENVAE